MLRRALTSTSLALTSLFLSGCLYSDVMIPLDTNLDETKLGTKTGESSSQAVLWMVAWGDSGTHAAAQAAGITTILHADQKIFSVLFGIYSKRTVVVYGD